MMRGLALAGALMLAAGPAVAAEPLGRLFFTTAQRASLDVARSQKSRTTLESEKSEAAPAPEVVTYGGMVRRSDGKTTVWINNRALHDNERSAGTTMVGRVRPDGGVSLQHPQTGRSVDLKPGQSVELLSGIIEEGGSRRLAAPKPEAKSEPKPAPDAKSARPAPTDSAKIERDREERQQQLEETVRTLQEAASAKPAATPPPQPAAGAGAAPSKNY
ncbi:MAG: hypothetical protein HYV99_02490 [Betaproteobacteria bacterium]|nr:hypothetical protein [Betaproteobacteria bacterium]MBI2508876.1 hypothetical protein [Betaproteobacteria bacterium]